jgi:hypothetical protein
MGYELVSLRGQAHEQQRRLLTCCANLRRSDGDVKNRSVAASFSGRLSYAASSQLAISFLIYPRQPQYYIPISPPTDDPPNGSHQTIHEKLVLLRGRFLPRIPDLTIASLHEPALKVDWVCYVGIGADFVGWERQ